MLRTGRWLVRHPGALIGLARGVALRDLILRDDLARLGHPRSVDACRGLAETRLHVGVVRRLSETLGATPPRTLLDVGAARGSFSTAAALAFPGVRAYAFEPLPEEFAVLRRHVRHAFPFALGAREEVATIHVSANPGSSSLARMLDAHVEAFPGTQTVREQRITVRRLDDVVAEGDLKLTPPVLLKIDVQGAEDLVLRGATATLRRVDAIIVELSLEPLYEGQLLADELTSRLAALGFRRDGTFNELRTAAGRVVQVDGLFRRAPESPGIR